MRDKVHWLRDSTMLARKVPEARISVFHYQSQWFGKGSVDQQLDNVVDQLLYQLKRIRGVSCTLKPCSFLLKIAQEDPVIAKKVNALVKKPK